MTADAEAVAATGARRWWLLVKLAVTAALGAWLLHGVELSGIAQAWREVGLLALLGALALQLLAYALGLWRWWLLLRYADVHVPYLSMKPAYYLGLFFNQVLPTGVGGDAVRTYHLYRRGLALRPLVGSALMDRLIGLFTITYLGLGGLLSSHLFILTMGDRMVLVAVAVLAAVGFLLLFLPTVHDLLQKPFARWRHLHAVSIASDILELCHSYGRAPRLLAVAVVLSLVMQATEVTIFVALGHALGLQVPVTVYFAAVPLAFVAASVPISLGGLGVREGVLAGLMMAAGVDKHGAVALAVLFLAVLWVSVLPGLLLFVRSRR